MLVGYNNFAYDDAILGEVVANPSISTTDLYKISQLLIMDREDVSPEQDKQRRDLTYKRRPWAFSIDLYQVNNRRGSLKEQACRLNLPKVSDCPLPFDQPVGACDIAAVLAYNLNDVKVTVEVLEASRNLIELRAKLSADYGLGHGVYCMNDAKIAETYMVKRGADVGSAALRKMAALSLNNLAQSFEMTDLVPQGVGFSSPDYQAMFDALKVGRVNRNDAGGFDLVTSLAGNAAEINGLKLTFGCGGLHSDDAAGAIAADDDSELWDVDAASFYPGQMISFKIHPAHMGEKFTGELTQLRDQRLRAKADGDKVTANALKLIINSIFGKLGNRYSPLRDDRACMQVTLGGQVLMLSLMEVVSLAGAVVLSVNTDGLLLRVPKTMAPAVRRSLRDWEGKVGFTIEEHTFRLVARRDINNFIAFSANSDEVKCKGVYNADAAKASGRAIPLAIREYLLTGKPLADVIRENHRAADFLFNTRVRSDQALEFQGHRLPRTVRWYAAIDGDPLMRVDSSGQNSVTVPHGHHARLALDLPDGFTIGDLPGLDIDYYVDQAQALLNAAKVGQDVDVGTDQARQVQSMGLTLLPQCNSRNPQGVALNDIQTIRSLQLQRCERWAIVTGPETQTLVLDLDKPDKLSPELIKILAASPTFTSWHGTGTADEVRTGQKRGAVTYFYRGGDTRLCTKSDQSWTNKHGFEVAYGKKVQTVIGQHRSARDYYAQAGVPVEAPAELIEFLVMRLPKRRKVQDTEAEAKPVSSGELEILRQAADAVLGAGWARVKVIKDDERVIAGVTPGHESDLHLRVHAGRVRAHSFHASYNAKAIAAAIQIEYRKLVKTNGSESEDESAVPVERLDPSDMPTALDADGERTATDCADAFGQIAAIGAIIGPMGTGKSWQAAKHAIERHNLGQTTLLVAQDKEAIEQLRKYVVMHWLNAGRELKELRLQVITSMNASDDDGEDGAEKTSKKTSIRKSALILLTHHHYASRKPLGIDLYSVLLWVKATRAEVILDEVDMYIERQNHDLQLDARYRYIGGDNGQWYKAIHCPSLKGAFHCKTCLRRRGGPVINHGTHSTYGPPGRLMPSQFTEPAREEFIVQTEDLDVEDVFDLPALNLRLSKLMQSPSYLTQRDFTPSKPWELGAIETAPTTFQKFTIYLKDLIECAHRPTMAEPKLVDDQGKIVEDDPWQLAKEDDAVLDAVKCADWNFPYFPCNTRYLLLYDRAPMFFMMKYASRVILMSATIGEQHLEFLRDCAAERPVVTVNIPQPVRTPLEHVVLIGHQERVNWTGSLGDRAANAMGCDYTNVAITNRTTIERLGNALAAAGKPPLIFMPTKEEATSLFSGIKERGWNLYIEGEYRMHTGRAAVETEGMDGSMVLLSYARSSIGTGANLPQYDVVVVDGTVRRPHYVFNPTLKTEDAYLTAQESDRVRIMTQNVGRILRGSGVKFVFVVGISPTQMTMLAEAVGCQAKTKTSAWLTEGDKERAMAALVASVKAGKLVVPEVPPAPEKTRETMSRKQRAVADRHQAPVVAVEPSVDRLTKAIGKATELAREGATWRMVSRAVNASRFTALERDQIRSAFEDGRLKDGVAHAEDESAEKVVNPLVHGQEQAVLEVVDSTTAVLASI